MRQRGPENVGWTGTLVETEEVGIVTVATSCKHGILTVALFTRSSRSTVPLAYRVEESGLLKPSSEAADTVSFYHGENRSVGYGIKFLLDIA